MYHIKITLQGHTRFHVNHIYHSKPRAKPRETTRNQAKPCKTTRNHGTMPNHAKPSQTTHNYYWEHIEPF